MKASLSAAQADSEFTDLELDALKIETVASMLKLQSEYALQRRWTFS